MKVIKYLSTALFLVTLLSSPSNSVDNHTDIENHTFHVSSFKLPSLKKMVILSLVAFSDTVSGDPTTPSSSLASTPCVIPDYVTHGTLDPDGIRRWTLCGDNGVCVCFTTCATPPLVEGGCKKRSATSARPRELSEANCLIPPECRDCKLVSPCIEPLWIAAGYREPLPGEITMLREAYKKSSL